MLELCLAVLLILVINRLFRNRDVTEPRERGAIIPGQPVDHGFDWEDYSQDCGNNAMQRLHEDMDRDSEEFIERMNDNRHRLFNDHHQ